MQVSDAELIALAAVVNAEVAEITAANAGRAARGEAMAYEGFLDSNLALANLVAALKMRGTIAR